MTPIGVVRLQSAKIVLILRIFEFIIYCKFVPLTIGFAVVDFILVPIFLNTADIATHWSIKKPLPVKIHDGIFLTLLNPNMTSKLPYHTPMLRERGLN